MPDFRDSRVADIMTPSVRTANAGTPLRQAAQLMFDARVTCLVVPLGHPSHGFGVLTQKDVLAAQCDAGAAMPGLTVGDVMTHPTITLNPSQHLGTAIQLMRMVGVRRAPVVDGLELVGLMTFTDVFRHAVESDTRRASA